MFGTKEKESARMRSRGCVIRDYEVYSLTRKEDLITCVIIDFFVGLFVFLVGILFCTGIIMGVF